MERLLPSRLNLLYLQVKNSSNPSMQNLSAYQSPDDDAIASNSRSCASSKLVIGLVFIHLALFSFLILLLQGLVRFRNLGFRRGGTARSQAPKEGFLREVDVVDGAARIHMTSPGPEGHMECPHPLQNA